MERIDELLTFTGIKVASIKDLLNLINRLESDDEDDIVIDEHDLNLIMRDHEYAFVTAAQHQGKNAALEVMNSIIASLKLKINEEELKDHFAGAAMIFQMNPEYPFMEISAAMDLLREMSCNEDITFGITSDQKLPSDFIRVTAIITDKGDIIGVDKLRTKGI